MAFGEMVTQLRVDLREYEKGLKKAVELADQANKAIARLSTTTLRVATTQVRSAAVPRVTGVSSPSHVSGAVAGGRSEVDQALRDMERLRKAVIANENTAENLSLKRIARLDKALEDNSRKREAEEKKLAAIREAGEKKSAAIIEAAEKRSAATREAAALRANAITEAGDKRVVAIREAGDKRAAAIKEVGDKRAARLKEAQDKRTAAKEVAEEKKTQAELLANRKKILAEGAAAFASEQSFEQKLAKQTAADFEKEFQKPLKAVVADIEQQALAQSKVTSGFKKNNENLKTANRLMGDFKNAVRVTAGYTAMYAAGGMFAGFALLAKEALKLNTEYQRNRQTIAEIMGMTTRWVDSQGRVVSQARQLSLNYAQADKLLPQIRLEAQKLNLTFEEGAKLFAESFGMAGRHGINAQQALPIVGQISELAKQLGSDPLRELRALLGGIRPAQSKILISLGLEPKALRSAMESGHLLQFLNDVFRKGAPYIKEYEHSWEVVSTTLVSSAQEVLRIATQRVFDRITDQVGGLNKAFSEENIKRWGKQLGDAITNAYDEIQAFTHSDAFKALEAFFKLLINNADKIIAVFAAYKSAALIGAGAQGVRGIAAEMRAGAGAAAGAAATGAVEAGAATGIGTQLLTGGGLAGLIRAGIVYDVVQLFRAAMAVLQQQGAERSSAQTERDIQRMSLGTALRQRVEARTRLQRAQEEVQRQQAITHGETPVMTDEFGRVSPAFNVNLKKAEREYKAALDNFHKADEAYAKSRGYTYGEAAKKQKEMLHQESIQYQQFQDARTKDALYLKRLQAKDKDDYVHQEHAKLSAALLAADKSLHTHADKLKARKILEKNFHDELEALRTKERLETHLAIAQDLDDRKAATEAEMELEVQKANDEISDPKLRGERIASLKIAYRRKVADVDREETQKALDLVKQFQDAVRKEGEERVQTAQKVRKLELEFGREMIHLTDERKKAIKNLYRTEAEEELKKRKSSIDTERLDIRKQARQFLDRSGISRDILEQLTSNTPLQGSAVTALQNRFQQLGLPVNPQAQAQIAALLQNAPSLNDATQAALMQQTLGRQEPGRSLTANNFSTEDIKAAEDAAKNNQLTTGQDILEKIVTILIGTNQFGFGARMHQIGAKEDLLQRDETQQKVAQEANDIGKAFEEAQKQVVELNDRQKELVQSYVDSTKQIKDGFMKDMQNIHATLVKLAPEFKHMYDQLVSSKVPIPTAFKNAFAHAGHAPTLAQVAAASGGQPNFYTINVTVPDTEAFKRMLANLIRAEGLKGNPLSKP